jgi:hypothetical protein
MWKRPSTYVILVTALASVGIGLLPYWPPIVAVLRLNEPGQVQNAVFAAVGIGLGLLTAVLSVLLLEQRHMLESSLTAIQAASRAGAVRLIRDDQFYAEFLQAARLASSTVCICYFGPRAPVSVADTDRKAYYRKIHRVMVNRSGEVKFRRLVRRSPENEAWVATAAEALDGTPRLDIALINDLDETKLMPLALSVQIIDQQKAWLVAVQSHEQIGDYRDVAIEGGDLPKVFQLYFDRLWREAEVILDSGMLTTAGKALIARNAARHQ